MQRLAWCLRVALSFGVILSFPSAGAAQFIALKTVPVASGDQFLLFPSQNLGMGGVSFALDDPMLDPFVNPAKGSRVVQPYLFTAPVFYSLTRNAGSSGAVSVGGLFGGRVFGGGMVSLQQIKRGDEFFGPVPLADIALPPNALRARSATNKYGFLTIGTRLPGDVAIGASGFFADLNAVDGVERLYAMASSVQQSGALEDVRVGITKGFGDGRVLEALGLFRRFDMEHNVAYVDWILVDSLNWTWEEQIREERNQDKTNTWGGQVAYRQPVGSHGWQVGGSLTGNWKSHPKIPNYEIMNIPRDPGSSTAFSIGIGVAKQTSATTFGIDLMYEPGNSTTWAEAEAPTPTASGGAIPIGGHTIDNEFGFSNAALAMGVTRQVGPAAFQFGLNVRAYDYRLDQWNNFQETFRRQDEQWIEWTPSWGFRLQFGDLELRYLGRVTTGTGRPGVAWDAGVLGRAEDMAAANDILLAPSGPLTLQYVTVVTNQLSITIPIR